MTDQKQAQAARIQALLDAFNEKCVGGAKGEKIDYSALNSEAEATVRLMEQFVLLYGESHSKVLGLETYMTSVELGALVKRDLQLPDDAVGHAAAELIVHGMSEGSGEADPLLEKYMPSGLICPWDGRLHRAKEHDKLREKYEAEEKARKEAQDVAPITA